MALPPSRYRVEERGRRLVTIDTRTGQEFGADMALGSAPVRDRMTAAPVSKMLERVGTDAPLSQRSALSAVTIAPASGEARPSVAGLNLKPGSGAKLATLAAGVLMLAVFLIITNLWIVVVIAFAIAPVRSAALTLGKAALRKYLDQAATG